jgi:hypothetical protein
LYGIFDHLKLQHLPHVDYTKPVQYVYCDITRAILQDEQNLNLLYMTGLPPNLSDLPTWVPDYSNNDFVKFVDLIENNASAGWPCEFSFETNRLAVSLKAVVLDKIREQALSTSICTADFRRGFAARPNLSNSSQRHAAVTELIRTLRSWIKVSQIIDRYPTGEDSSTAFYKIMTQPLRPGSQEGALFSPPRVAQSFFREWSSIVTADVSQDMTRFHADIANIESEPDSAAIIDDYIRLFGCSHDPRTWSAAGSSSTRPKHTNPAA